MSPSVNRMEVFQRGDGEYAFRHKAANNEKTAGGEGYPSKRLALNAARREHPDLPLYDVTGEDPQLVLSGSDADWDSRPSVPAPDTG